MASNKGRKISTYTHKESGISVEIRLDKDLTFNAFYEGKWYSAPTAAALETELATEISKTFAVKWIPVLEVTAPSKNQTDEESYAAIEFRRFQYSPRGDKEGLGATWGVDPADRIHRTHTNIHGELDLPDTTPPTKDRWGDLEYFTWYFEYDEAHYQALCAVRDGLAGLNLRLLNIRDDPAALNQVAGVLAQLAPPINLTPKPYAEEDEEEDETD